MELLMSKDGQRVIRKVRKSRRSGPFLFFYVVTHEARYGQEFWTFLDCKSDGFLASEPTRQKMNKYGSRAFAIEFSIARKPEKIPSGLFKTENVQLQLT
jgi:hypothetical protein